MQTWLDIVTISPRRKKRLFGLPCGRNIAKKRDFCSFLRMISKPVKVGIYIMSVAVLAVAIAYVPPGVNCGDTGVVVRELLPKIEVFRDKVISPNTTEMEACNIFREDGIPLMNLVKKKLETYKNCHFNDDPGIVLKDLEQKFEALQWYYAQGCVDAVT